MKLAIRPKSLTRFALLLTTVPVLFTGLQLGIGTNQELAVKMGAVMFLALCFALVGVLVLTAVHEGGHFFAAKSLGLKVMVVKIGPFVWKKEGWGTDLSPLDKVSGFVFARMADWRLTRQHFAWMVAAGPLASVVAAVLSLALLPLASSLSIRGPFPLIALKVAIPAVVVGAWLYVLVTVVPYTFRGFASDGLHLWLLSRGGGRGTRYAMSIYVATSVFAGARFRTLPLELVHGMMAVDTGDEEEATAKYHAYAFYRDSGKSEDAKGAIARALELVTTKGTKNQVLAQAVRIEGAFVSDDAVAARQLLNEVGTPVPQVATWMKRAEAHVLLLEGKKDGAQSCLAEFLSLAEKELQGVPERLASARESVAGLLASANEK